MRVLHLGKFFPPFAGGIEHFLADLLPALRAQSVDCAALVHGHDGHNAGGVEDYQGSPVYRVPCYGRLLYAPVSPAFPLWLRRALTEFRPDLLHLHLPNTSAFWALASPAARRLPWVVHWHADVVASALERRLALAYRLYRPFEQRLLRRSRAVIATSPPYLATSPALAPWRARSEIIPLGIPPTPPVLTAAAVDRAERLWGQPGGRILSVGRLTYYKGHEVLIRAARRLPDAKVLIAGGGEREPALRSLIAELGLDRRVVLLGHTDPDLLQTLLAGCGCFCLPSLERTEAFGVVLLEAMRHGKPLVVSDIAGSGAGWIVRQGDCGRLVPPGAAGELAAALRALLDDPNEAARRGANGRRALNRSFAIGRVARRTAELYARCG